MKRLLLLIGLLPALAWGQVKVNALPSGSTPTGADFTICDQSSVTNKCTMAQLETYIAGALSGITPSQLAPQNPGTMLGNCTGGNAAPMANAILCGSGIQIAQTASWMPFGGSLVLLSSNSTDVIVGAAQQNNSTPLSFPTGVTGYGYLNGAGNQAFGLFGECDLHTNGVCQNELDAFNYAATPTSTFPTNLSFGTTEYNAIPLLTACYGSYSCKAGVYIGTGSQTSLAGLYIEPTASTLYSARFDAPSGGPALYLLGSSGNYAAQIYGANSATGTAANFIGQYSGSGNTALVNMSDVSNSNGVNLHLSGNGGTNPGKTIRVVSGNFQILNNAYTNSILSLTDAGTLSLPSTTTGTNSSFACFSSAFALLTSSTPCASDSANPSATIGLSAVNGTATTFMTSDSAPALSQSIAPTWTGSHTFTPASGTGITVNSVNGQWGQIVYGANGNNGQGLRVYGTYTGNGTTELVNFSDVNNTNGLNVLLTGNGSNANKTIRVINGTFEILNSAYTAQLLNITDSGLVGIPQITTGTNADFVCMNSSLQFTIQSSACTISSLRFKENVEDHEGSALPVIGKLEVADYNLKDTHNKDPNSTTRQTGLIAENIAKVAPECAIYEDDMTTPKSYRQECVIALLVKGEQELAARPTASGQQWEIYGLAVWCMGLTVAFTIRRRK